MPVQALLSQHPTLSGDRLSSVLVGALSDETGTTSAGFPFLSGRAFRHFRDQVPHILGMGAQVIDRLATIGEVADTLRAHDQLTETQHTHVTRSRKVVAGCVRTAAITAPSDLWLLRHVLGALSEVGLLERLLAGETIIPAQCRVQHRGAAVAVDAAELERDLMFVVSRGYLDVDEGTFRLSERAGARAVLRAMPPAPRTWPADVSRMWARLFGGGTLPKADIATLVAIGSDLVVRKQVEQRSWIATREEIELGYRLLPIIIGLRAAHRSTSLAKGELLRPESIAATAPEAGKAAIAVLSAAGVLQSSADGAHTASVLGKRVFARGAGPMGIIEAYHPYMTKLTEMLVRGRGSVWVGRGANIAASQDANRRTFERANNMLDAFCQRTGFTYDVFIEHAVGRGEATRQRYERSGDAMRYFGADLEDAAIDACIAERDAGNLPETMEFIRNADIGDPARLVRGLVDRAAKAHGAVMVVGNGFHEVRDQTDERMISIFKAYHDAGIVLIFTEESALSIDDLLHTAWNTYHAGFKYVHDKSGQGLRPAEPGPKTTRGRPMKASWRECAEKAGYQRVKSLSRRSRTIYPSKRSSGHNPSISVNHFFVPRGLVSAS
ncbi:MAG: hypothetical protein KC502_15530 [Myxococcales bacterium]|nr:hypothetical protein [Myxococcales bacterium]